MSLVCFGPVVSTPLLLLLLCFLLHGLCLQMLPMPSANDANAQLVMQYCKCLRCCCSYCCVQNPPDWQEILQYFRGSELQNYFTRVLEDDLKAVIKPQYVVSGSQGGEGGGCGPSCV